MSEHDDSEKTLEATPERRKKAREDGQFPRSRDAAAVAASLAVLAGLMVFQKQLGAELRELASACFSQTDQLRSAGVTRIAGQAMTSLAFAPGGANVTVVSDGDKVTVWRVATGERVAELRGRVSLRQADGASLWPIPPRLLTRVGCQRLGQFTRGYAEVAEICDPLVATARSL